MSTRMLAAAALLALPLLADEPAAASPTYTLVLAGSPSGTLTFSDIDSLVPLQILRSASTGPTDTNKDGKFKKPLVLKGTFSRPWDGEIALAGSLGHAGQNATFTLNAPAGTPPLSGVLEQPVPQEWSLSAEYGVSASERIDFTYVARSGAGK
ncbi:hypothetical protein [Mesoterricola sediminis]|uniref:Uncharacterized protein n=1 Tax=Mesoterricola sediminis TaxID=2927980 RepID=A0AA48KCA2_9BACT|nr:hypothetical protein [Mesoterricola sediminis]BDU76939.1 hypothetical protein METESE_18970 [Mesoterricola sediminis]